MNLLVLKGPCPFYSRSGEFSLRGLAVRLWRGWKPRPKHLRSGKPATPVWLGCDAWVTIPDKSTSERKHRIR